MAYIEIKERNGIKYYYMTESIRNGLKIKKKRRYLGANLTAKEFSELYKKKAGEKIRKNIHKIKPRIVNILKKEGVKKAAIFGSYATGKQKPSSDIDIVIEPSKGMGFRFAGLQIKLSDALKRKVDLLSYSGLSPYLKKKILEQEIRIV